MSARKITLLSLYTALALIIFMVESALPGLTPLPFIKLGLANVITLIVLVLYSPKDALIVFFMRILLASVFTGQIVYLLYSFAGGILCFAADCGINHLLKGKYLYITSIFGAVFHNIGQLGMAVILMGTGVLPYFPYLMIAGIITGLFTGILAEQLVKRVKKLKL
ncbi:MAG: Gx transporter family protein [Lachnospiraceae bacterium]|nr:Gx transporter family protein [Lachnospiraceae bacterium]